MLRNLIYNLSGNLIVAICNLIFAPVLVGLLGAKSYGMISLYIMVGALSPVLDFGLPQLLTREAALHTSNDYSQRSPDIFKTIVIAYITISVLIFFLIALFNNEISYYWLQEKENRANLSSLVIIIGGCISLSFLTRIYSAGLLGFERQGLINAIIGISAVIQNVFTVMLVYFYGKIETYFVAQLIVAFILLIIYWLCYEKCLLRFGLNKGRIKVNFFFDNSFLYGFRIYGITITGTILGQLDKLILSAMLQLDLFGLHIGKQFCKYFK
jgi:O-antigen/teichoic acid export membrane protein